jgi:hypothetical protein
MGDRVSIQFKNKDMEWGGESVVLFHHWGGQKFADFAKAWAIDFKMKILKLHEGKGSDSLSRLEPQNIMVQFLKHISDNAQTHGLNHNVYIDGKYTKITDLLSYSMYFGKDENDGDNSDNGHHIIELSE